MVHEIRMYVSLDVPLELIFGRHPSQNKFIWFALLGYLFRSGDKIAYFQPLAVREISPLRP